MNKLKKGEFYGNHYQKLIFDEFSTSDTEYTHPKVDWHYHESPYFTYLLRGKLFEANKKTSYYLGAGSLLFHNWQDAHYNLKPEGYTRGFHVELNSEWFKKHTLNNLVAEGSLLLENPMITGAFNRVILETKLNDAHSRQSIEMLLLEVFSHLQKDQARMPDRIPNWIKTLQEILKDEEINSSLSNLSSILNVHPVHISRSFHHYFKVTLGEYLRHIKLNKAIRLMMRRESNMTEICYQCGFYDQSHFIKTFKRMYKVSPSDFTSIFYPC